MIKIVYLDSCAPFVLIERECVIWFLIARNSYTCLDFIIYEYFFHYGMNYEVSVSTVMYNGVRGKPNKHIYVQLHT